MLRKSLMFPVGLTVAIAVAGLVWLGMVNPAQAADPDFKIRFGNLYPQAHSIGIGADKFAELVTQKTGGKVKVEVFHNSVLGSEREMTEAVKTGSLEMVVSGLAGIGLYVPGIHVFELPYLYNSMDHLKKIAYQLEPEMQKLLTAKGFRTLGFNYQGPRSTLCVKSLKSLDDFKRLRLRVPEAPLYVGMAKAMGADPTPVAYPEVYTALQTGIAEAMEGSPDSIFNNRFYEVAKHLTLTKHIYHVLYVAINEKFYQSLPADVQKALIEAGKESSEVQLAATVKFSEESLEKMKSEGLEVIELADLKPFQTALQSFNESYAQQKGPEAVEMLKKIQAIDE